MSATPRVSGVDGILNIDKPYGITSMEMVRTIKRASRLKRVGHGGTLDPIATGVVAVCLGQATRFMEYVVDGTKEYEAVIELGATTDTYDAMGEVTGRRDSASVTLSDVERALDSFRGVIDQVPPMYSALKRQGKRLYELARAGIEVERQPRRVEIHSVELVEWTPPMVTTRVSCGRGFYMRSLAYDLGELLGCGGHLKSLVRLRSGIFKLSDAIPLTEAALMFEEDTWQEALYAPDAVLHQMGAAIVSKRLEEMMRHGQPLPADVRLSGNEPQSRCRAYGVDGGFVGTLVFDASAAQWRPDKVFSLAYPEDEPTESP